MNDSLKHILFTETDCLSEQTMFDYIDKKLNAKECHVVEKHLLHCDLCSDALEGLGLTKNRSRIQSINQKIREHIAAPATKPKTNNFNYKLVISIAATVLLLIGGVFLFKQFSENKEMAEFIQEPATPELKPATPQPASDNAFSDSINTAPSIPMKDAAEEKKSDVSETPKQEQSITRNEQQLKLNLGTTANTNQSDATGSISPAQSSAPTEEYDGGDLETQAPSPKAQDKIAAEMEDSETSSGRTEIKSESIALTSKSASKRDRDDSEMKKSAAKKSSKSYNTISDEVKEKPKAEEKELSDMQYATQSIALANETIVGATSSNSNAETMPEYPGGQDSLKKFITSNFKYSENSKKENWIGQTIYVSFIVNEKGKIKTPKILKGINSELDKEALRVVKSMPNWKPAMQEGKPASVNYDLPIKLD